MGLMAQGRFAGFDRQTGGVLQRALSIFKGYYLKLFSRGKRKPQDFEITSRGYFHVYLLLKSFFNLRRVLKNNRRKYEF